ncbi:hypothetical protein [Pelomicrobium sp. G1]|uniref:hypothetical protein n=1 Tax=unclassified Pelomicrobium TaxID=2815318 RepID=UPI003F75CFA9
MSASRSLPRPVTRCFTPCCVYYDELVGTLTRRLGDRFEAEDVAQETVVRLLEAEGAAPGGTQAVPLTAGLGTRIDAQGRIEAPRPMDFAAATAWREGRLAFDGATLAEVVRELARYSAHPATGWPMRRWASCGSPAASA